MRRFRIEAWPVPGERAALSPEASHHLLRVLRASSGDHLTVFDGEGREAEAVVALVDGGLARLDLVTEPRHAAPGHPLHLLVGVAKGPAMDLAIRQATEAGATEIHPVLAARSVARGDRTDRWTRITTSAAQQCGRGDLPKVHPLVTLGDALQATAHVPDRRVAVPGAPRGAPSDGPAAVLIGPEGGLTDAEIRAALDHGYAPMGLGRWVLRTSTAAGVAVAWLAPDLDA